jgi:hypothetical protein
MSKKESFFSKKAIASSILSVIDYINDLNKDNESYIVPDKEKVGAYLVSISKISDGISDIINENDKPKGTCHAMVKKKISSRCNNPIKISNSRFCSYHNIHKPDVTWESYKLLKEFKK